MSSNEIFIKTADWYYRTQFKSPPGRKVAYVSAFAPVELLRALDIACVYPENQAAAVAGTRQADAYIRSSLKKHFSKNLCGYARIYAGLNATDFTPNEIRPAIFPPADLIVGSNNQCETIHNWFSCLARERNVPVLLLDYPSMTAGGGHADRYVREQHRSLIDFVMTITGNSFDKKKFRESVKASAIANAYWYKIHRLGVYKPSKVDVASLFNEMFPLVVARGTDLAARYYKELYKEKKAACRGEKEKIRLLWYGYPFWFLKSRLPFQVLPGCVINTYTMWWILDYSGNAEKELLTHTYRNTYLNSTLAYRLQHLNNVIDDYTIDAVIIHINRSCKRDAFGIRGVKKMLYRLKIPSLTIEADMIDKKEYAESNIADRIEKFMSIVKKRGR